MEQIRCPECLQANDVTSSACHGCGLLLIGAAPAALPKRRQEDMVAEKRRASDREKSSCPYCKAMIDSDVARCRFCGEIVSEEHRRARVAQLRSTVNYASWVSYLLGLLLFLFFRPVGLIAIGAGLILSVVYYAIPLPQEGQDPRTHRFRLLRFLRELFAFERVKVAIPHMRRRRLVFAGTPIAAALIGYALNFLLLQQPMNRILDQNASFAGMSVATHYEYWVFPGTIVYDLRAVGDQQSILHVHAALVEYAKTMQHSRSRHIDLSYKGTKKLRISGDEFRKVGAAYGNGNLRYVLFEFPRQVLHRDRSSEESEPEPHRFLLDLHRTWYGDAARLQM